MQEAKQAPVADSKPGNHKSRRVDAARARHNKEAMVKEIVENRLTQAKKMRAEKVKNRIAKVQAKKAEREKPVRKKPTKKALANLKRQSERRMKRAKDRSLCQK